MTDFHVPFLSYSERYPLKYEALYHAIKDSIADGKLEYGAKLPSSRELGKLYALSRGIVSQVYDMLASEGYVESEVGRGTYVAYRRDRMPAADEGGGRECDLSAWGRRIAAEPPHPSPEPKAPIEFAIGYGDKSLFPTTAWNRALYAQVRRMGDVSDGDVFAAEGHEPLREAVGRHLRRVRGIRADASSVAIVNGSMQAIGLLTQLLVEPGAPVVVENPCYSGFLSAIAAAGGRPVAAETDEHGIVPSDWDAKLLFVTPSRQFPTGAVLGLERRQRLLAWAAERGAIVVEDDYDSEFRHRGRPIEPLKALDRDDRVVYVGTFTRTMMHHFRIGYAVLPARLREPFLRAKRLFEPHPASILEQRALAAFMNGGEYERHLRRLGRVYSRKFELLRGLLASELAGAFAPVPSDAGLHVFARWRGSAESYGAFRRDCFDAGVAWSDGSRYYAERPVASACFGFAHLSEADIAEGVRRMREAWERRG
ncbi:PLP-dependent aminotransferase family protein [Paenibacillus flagellatus]|uniref:PLP-dependent aminotransferase family protein n=1 Tax=Paenibacillus flagellatus TaxID=2211139 RepID=A0A2V5JYU3_9BACL|nr:PLP-dependent aminotransferase family protein [Paenibacillus flagellatus]PYI52069.1 PLP-dependent aminotransferase family protein [Paenibacillus flagellatus]